MALVKSSSPGIPLLISVYVIEALLRVYEALNALVSIVIYVFGHFNRRGWAAPAACLPKPAQALPRPSRVALVLAETPPHDVLSQLISHQLRILANLETQTVYLYDPEGVLKAQAKLLQRYLRNDMQTADVSWSIAVGGKHAAVTDDKQRRCEAIGQRLPSTTSNQGDPLRRQQQPEPQQQDAAAQACDATQINGCIADGHECRAVPQQIGGDGGASETSAGRNSRASGIPPGGKTTVTFHLLSANDALDPLMETIRLRSAAVGAAGTGSAPSPAEPVDLLAPTTSYDSLMQGMASVSGDWVMQPPQAILVFGRVLSLVGYPPFHTKNSEIFMMGPLERCGEEGVLSAIAKYCRTQQRFGS